MGKQTLTQWFPADVKPVHVGVYERMTSNWDNSNGYAFWDGEKWGGFAKDFYGALQRSSWDNVSPNDLWRGLAVKP